MAIEYRWAENQIDRLSVLAAELVRRNVAVIAASGGPAVSFAAKAATRTTPIVFLSAEDPVRLGLVTSLARPTGNLTGINFFNRELAETARILARAGARSHSCWIARQPAPVTETTSNEVQLAARAMGLQVAVLNASTGHEIDAAFTHSCARTLRWPLRRPRPLLQRSASSVVSPRHAPCDSRDLLRT